MAIEVVDYNPDWPKAFEVATEQIKLVLGEQCLAIHHIGLTSVEGLSAKPIIDILVAVKDICAVDILNPTMSTIGYESKGEYGIPFRRYFQKEKDVKTHNLHVFEQGNPEIERHIKFRDWMRSHVQDREAYADLKQRLSAIFSDDRESYSLGKEEFITNIDAKAGWNGTRIVIVHTPKEWEAYHRIRKKQIFEPINVEYDPHYPTITTASHFNFALIKGANIVTVAMVEVLNNDEAALRSLATDEIYKKQGFGKIMMALLEKWLKQKNIRIIKMHAAIRAEAFYTKLGYYDITFNDTSVISSNTVDLGEIL